MSALQHLRRHRLVFAILFLFAAVTALLLSIPPGEPDLDLAAAQPQLILAGRDSSAFNLDPTDLSFEQPREGGPVYPVSMDTDLRDLPQAGPEAQVVIPEFEPWLPEAPDPDFIDPVLQDVSGGLSIPSPGVNFAGMNLSSNGAGWPPDTHGDIGPTHYIQTVNTSIGIYTRTGTPVSTFTFNTLFSGTGTPCDASNTGDPITLYDDVSDRWILTDFAWTDFVNGPYYQCIAVSKTGDPVSGGWWLYAIIAHNTWLNDYPKLGGWHDGIYMTANLFDILSSLGTASFKGVRVWALNRENMISGSPLSYQYGDLGSAYYSLLPSNARGSSMPGPGTPNYLTFRYSSTDLITLKLYIDWNNVANSVLQGTFWTTVSSNSTAGNIPQPNGQNLASLSPRLMTHLQYSEASGEGALWATHTVATGGIAALRWYELRNLDGSPTVYQEGTFSPNSTHRWMGALGVDQDGNMGITYSAGSASVHPQIRYTGRMVTDTLGMLGLGEGTLIAGAGDQTSLNRWGDYASLTVDPLDECTFWFTTEYYAATGTDWHTRIGSFKVPQCPAPLGNRPHAAISVSGADALLSWTPVLTKANGMPADIAYYRVYSSTGIVISPTYQVTETAFLTHTLTGAGASDVPIFYEVIAGASNGNLSDASNIVGVFPFSLVPGLGEGPEVETAAWSRPRTKSLPIRIDKIPDGPHGAEIREYLENVAGPARRTFF